jgi:hypothetical protein
MNQNEVIKTLTSIEIMMRRAAVFEYYVCRKLSPKRIVEILEKRGLPGCSLPNIRHDIYTMSKWLPEIVKIQEESAQVTSDLLGKMQVTQQRMLNLGETADNSNAQVGALRANVDAINAEVDLRIKTGQIHAIPIQVEFKGQVNEHGFSPGSFFAKYGDVLLDEVLRRRLQKDRGDDRQNHGEPVDPSHPNP